jgi:hypothetical protein
METRGYVRAIETIPPPAPLYSYKKWKDEIRFHLLIIVY